MKIGNDKKQNIHQERVLRAKKFYSKLENVTHHGETKEIRRSATFWTLSKSYKNKTVTVLIRQLQGGQKHFFSIVDKKLSSGRIRKLKNPPKEIL